MVGGPMGQRPIPGWYIKKYIFLKKTSSEVNSVIYKSNAFRVSKLCVIIGVIYILFNYFLSFFFGKDFFLLDRLICNLTKIYM